MSGSSGGAPRSPRSAGGDLAGSVPVAISVMRTPSEYRSAAGLSSRPATCSGAMYAGVPIGPSQVVASGTPSIARAMPKSVTTARSLPPCTGTSMTLLGLRSRWRTPSRCAAATPEAILRDQLSGDRLGKRTVPAQTLGKRLALEQLHAQEQRRLSRAPEMEFEHAADVGVRDLPGEEDSPAGIVAAEPRSTRAPDAPSSLRCAPRVRRRPPRRPPPCRHDRASGRRGTATPAPCRSVTLPAPGLRVAPCSPSVAATPAQSATSLRSCAPEAWEPPGEVTTLRPVAAWVT